MARMREIRKGGDFQTLAQTFALDPLIIRLLFNRGADTKEKIEVYLHGGEACLHNPVTMKDLPKACEILLEKCRQNARVRIMGDYDIDGVCSTAILLKALSLTGLDADAVIPHRIRDGYGLNDQLIDAAWQDKIDTIITCDNGISAQTQIQRAREFGMTVIVTDHHEVPYHMENGVKSYQIPPADAVVDPKQPGCSYPFREICGAYVAYQFMCLFYTETYAGQLPGWKERKEKWKILREELLVLAAFATIGDVMPLQDENRALVKLGLDKMQDCASLGLQALLAVCGLKGTKLEAYHIGFQLGPCVNATGRIDTASRALELLMATQKEEAMQLAGDLKAMNDSRKELTQRGLTESIQIIEEKQYTKDKVLVVYLPDCHESVAGIIAGRIREKYERPAFVLTDAETEEEEPVLKGSGRSTENYPMYDAMNEVGEIFCKFGGHAQAAGFSIYKKNLEKMRQMLNDTCRLTVEEMQEIIRIDAEVAFSYHTPERLNQLSCLEPFGNGNPKPLFGRQGLILRSVKTFGTEEKVGKYKVTDRDGSQWELTMFGRNKEFRAFLEQKYGVQRAAEAYRGFRKENDLIFTAAYYPGWNEYMGRKSIQFIMTFFC